MATPFTDSDITTGELIDQLKHYPADTPISFGFQGQFTFYRVKDRSGVVQIEFGQVYGEEADIKFGIRTPDPTN